MRSLPTGLFFAYLAGRQSFQRESCMNEARRAKHAGNESAMRSFVYVARECNKYTVRNLIKARNYHGTR